MGVGSKREGRKEDPRSCCEAMDFTVGELDVISKEAVVQKHVAKKKKKKRNMLLIGMHEIQLETVLLQHEPFFSLFMPPNL